jgi:hypothetical protein
MPGIIPPFLHVPQYCDAFLRTEIIFSPSDLHRENDEA